MCCYAPRGVEVCVGMKQVDVRVIIVQCLEQDFILDKHYNTVTLLTLLLYKSHDMTNQSEQLSEKDGGMHFWREKLHSEKLKEYKLL